MIKQPISTDKLNSPDHSLSHRVFANDDAAPAQSVVVNSDGSITMAANVDLGANSLTADIVNIDTAFNLYYDAALTFFSDEGVTRRGILYSEANSQYNFNNVVTGDNGILDFTLVGTTGVDKTFTFPDQTGTLALIENSSQISSGTSAPNSTPTKIGDIFVDTNAKKLYFATGITSSSDWTIAN